MQHLKTSILDRVPVSVSEWLFGSFVLILFGDYVFLLFQQSSFQRVRRQCCLIYRGPDDDDENKAVESTWRRFGAGEKPGKVFVRKHSRRPLYENILVMIIVATMGHVNICLGWWWWYWARKDPFDHPHVILSGDLYSVVSNTNISKCRASTVRTEMKGWMLHATVNIWIIAVIVHNCSLQMLTVTVLFRSGSRAG